jgi:hypothetical protein
MNEAAAVWDRIDLPVLRWVAEAGYEFQWRFERNEPTEEVPSLSGDELDAALRRLQGHGLVSAGGRTETSGYYVWWRLRPTSDGWRVLGQWPPANEADMGTAVVEILRRLANEASADEAKRLRRAAGSVARFGGRVVFDVAKGEIRQAGGDLTT